MARPIRAEEERNRLQAEILIAEQALACYKNGYQLEQENRLTSLLWIDPTTNAPEVSKVGFQIGEYFFACPDWLGDSLAIRLGKGKRNAIRRKKSPPP
jgi:hypothetical protein